MNTLTKKQMLHFTLLLGLFSPIAGAVNIEGVEEIVTTCQGCHGEKGVSSNPVWPSLAGQQRTYLENQIKAFKSGERNNPTMRGMVAGLDENDIEKVAAYFASQSSKSAGGDAALAEKGKNKATMCMGCHGNNAQGRGQFPKLAGQHPQYLAKQLTDFKNGVRKGGPMGGVVKNLSEQDIKEISAFLGGL